MQYRTEIKISELFPKINPSDKITLLGSCFSDNIGKKLINSKFSTTANPLGIIFNPVSISKLIVKYFYEKIPVGQEDLVIENGIVSHPDFHSNHNTLDKKSYINSINKKIVNASTHLKDSKVLILTLGTAWVYLDNKSHSIVSNCHKRAQHNFSKQLLSIEEIVESISRCIDISGISIILTVSPVRHIKDGIPENSRSKARLIEACHVLTEIYEQCHYFPAYEILMDDLRDYRYYDIDMVHPSPLAVEYVWELFAQYAFDETGRIFKTKNEKLAAAIKHKARFPSSETFLTFCKNQIKIINGLQEEYSFVNYREELDHFSQYLH